MDSTSNHQSHYQHQFQNLNAASVRNEQAERLHMELLSKNNEIENITKVLNNERKNFDELKKRYVL